MIKENIFELESPYRDTFRITAYRFGDCTNPEVTKSCAVVGAMRGNEVQQLFISSQLIKALKALEKKGDIKPGHEIVVIPSINHYSLNINKRFWALDNTDINRMFPGYDKGETTQRIAYHVFNYVKAYDNGIQFASSYMPGNFAPHVRMMKTAFIDVEGAKYFGLPYIFIRDCKPYDTTTLNYNWQLWNTSAYSLYSGATATIDETTADRIITSVLSFLTMRQVIKGDTHLNESANICHSKDFKSVLTTEAGTFRPLKHLGDQVAQGDCLAEVLHAYEGHVIERILAPSKGEIFFIYDQPYVQESVSVFRIIALQEGSEQAKGEPIQ